MSDLRLSKERVVKIYMKRFFLAGVMLLLAGCQLKEAEQVIERPEYADVSVHDPSIIRDKDTYYIIGSHMQFAKSDDLIQWKQLSNSVADSSLFNNIREELADEFDYAQTDTLWASDIQQFKMVNITCIIAFVKALPRFQF